MIIKMSMFIITIVAPVGNPNSNEIHIPPITDNSENKIAIETVFLKLLPIFIAAATGIIINEDTKRTPHVTNYKETTTAQIEIIINEDTKSTPTVTIDKETTRASINVETN